MKLVFLESNRASLTASENTSRHGPRRSLMTTPADLQSDLSKSFDSWSQPSFATSCSHWKSRFGQPSLDRACLEKLGTISRDISTRQGSRHFLFPRHFSTASSKCR